MPYSSSMSHFKNKKKPYSNTPIKIVSELHNLFPSNIWQFLEGNFHLIAIEFQVNINQRYLKANVLIYYMRITSHYEVLKTGR